MSRALAPEITPWGDAMLAASLFAVDPAGIGGVAVRALPGPVRDRWLTFARQSLPASAPMRRVPLHAPDSRLLGGLDLAATLDLGRPVAERGILATANGGAVILAMAERLTPATVARLTAALDTGVVLVERDGLTQRIPTRLGVIALDEGIAHDERLAAALLDRLAFHVALGEVAMHDAIGSVCSAGEIEAARARLPAIDVDDEILEGLCAAALAMAIPSIRAPLLALRVARAAAALAGRGAVEHTDAVLAGRLVFAPRAMALPAQEHTAEQQASDANPAEATDAAPRIDDAGDDATADADQPLTDLVLAAARATMPQGVLAQLRLASHGHSRAQGKAGAAQRSTLRGRPVGARRGDPRQGARIDILETLRAAAPWQAIRRRESYDARSRPARPARIVVRRDDFRVTRFKHRTPTTTIFVVDASGSAALHRLAEVKGAVELLLADCYVRRDRVALLAFRGRGAELLLPPTRSLVRAKRSLASLPGGGGTPLAAGLDAAAALADTIRRKGETPVVVLLTDGRANIARDGGAGRARAGEEAVVAARAARAQRLTALLVDTSPQPQPTARHLAGEMGATYLPLPYADAAVLSEAVRASATPQHRGAVR